MSTRQIQRAFKCSMKTAWFLTHRIREIMERDDDLFSPPMGGDGKTIEADVTYVGRKPGTKVPARRGPHNPVFSLVERDGAVRSFHMPNVRGDNLRSVMAGHADRLARISGLTKLRLSPESAGISPRRYRQA